MVEKLIEKMFRARDASHRAHWATDSYAKHQALGGYYDEVIEQLDGFVEAYQGTFGLVPDVPAQPKDISKLIHDDIIWLNENRSAISKNVPALENLLDELTALHMKTLYKLENLR